MYIIKRLKGNIKTYTLLYFILMVTFMCLITIFIFGLYDEDLTYTLPFTFFAMVLNIFTIIRAYNYLVRDSRRLVEEIEKIEIIETILIYG